MKSKHLSHHLKSCIQPYFNFPVLEFEVFVAICWMLIAINREFLARMQLQSAIFWACLSRFQFIQVKYPRLNIIEVDSIFATIPIFIKSHTAYIISNAFHIWCGKRKTSWHLLIFQTICKYLLKVNKSSIELVCTMLYSSHLLPIHVKRLNVLCAIAICYIHCSVLATFIEYIAWFYWI